MRRNWVARSWPSLAAAGFLCGMGVEAWFMPKPADARAYHARVAEVAGRIPMRSADDRWVGQDVPVPTAAIKMLSPNAIVSRRYLDTAHGTEASMLLVQCGDARDMTAHYPPVCLVNAGWRLDEATPRRWEVAGMVIDGTQYQFSRRSFEAAATIRVRDFMVLPDGRIVPDMQPLIEAAADVKHRYFGAAQVQVVTDARLTPAEQDAAFEALVGTLGETLAAIRSGDVK